MEGDALFNPQDNQQDAPSSGATLPALNYFNDVGKDDKEETYCPENDDSLAVASMEYKNVANTDFEQLLNTILTSESYAKSNSNTNPSTG